MKFLSRKSWLHAALGGTLITLILFMTSVFISSQQMKLRPTNVPKFYEQSLLVNRPIFETIQRALLVCDTMDWEVVSYNPAKGIIEATATTPIFGFRDDVVIRIESEKLNQTRIDVHSVSRVGETDYGSNADRIRFYLDRLEKRLR